MIHRNLAEQIARYTPEDGIFDTAIPRLSLVRWSQEAVPVHMLQRPALCIIAQGAKQVMLGEKLFAYGPDSYLVASLDLPITGIVTQASADTPYLCLCLYFDVDLLTELMLSVPASVPVQDGGLGMKLDPASEDLVDAAARLTAVLGSPQDGALLAPLVERELLLRLITGPTGGLIRAIAAADSRTTQIARAIGWLKAHFRESYHGPDLARLAGMSLSGFHNHFRRATSMTPLQYQKQLRLQEARRLMLAEHVAAAEAADRVGYESPSQFSREYRRLFGMPPQRDAVALRNRMALPFAI